MWVENEKRKSETEVEFYMDPQEIVTWPKKYINLIFLNLRYKRKKLINKKMIFLSE